MKLFEKIKNHPKLLTTALSLAVTLAILVAAVVIMLPRSLAWFASNRHTAAGGMTLSAAEDYLRFADVFPAIEKEEAERLIQEWVTEERACLSVVRPREECV